MMLIAQPDNSNALLIEEAKRMMLANDIALSASWLDDHKHLLGDPHLVATAAALQSRLHSIARELAANRAGDIYDLKGKEEDDIERDRRLIGAAGIGGCANDVPVLLR